MDRGEAYDVAAITDERGRRAVCFNVQGLQEPGSTGMTPKGDLGNIIHNGTLCLTVERAERLRDDLGRVLATIARGGAE